MTAIVSANLVLKILQIEYHKIKSAILYAGISLIALVCASPDCFYFISYIYHDVDVIHAFYFALSDELYFGWEVFMFAFDLVPPIIILQKMFTIAVGKFKVAQREQFYRWKKTYLGSQVILAVWSLTFLCSVMSTLVSANILLKVLNAESDRVKSFCLYASLLAIAIVLGGPTFFYFIYFLAGDSSFIQNLYSSYVDQLYFGWESFMFLFDIIPPAIILFKMAVLKSKNIRQKEQIDGWKRIIYAMFVAEGVNIITYVVLFTLQYHTTLLGGDNQFESVWVLQLLNFFIHNMIILSLFECFKEMMKVTIIQVAINPKQSETILQGDANKDTLIEFSIKT
ncbi:hypothetical protein HDV01_000600 [Terramyces sp. JEL0728]|nr:hypothetical protein HDV01_000600 [Terramyces sp. JEL0728]